MLSLLIAYPIAYFLARKASPRSARIVLLLFTIPFLINYIIRNVAWTGLLGRTGTINTPLIAAGRHRTRRSTGCSTATSPSSSGWSRPTCRS